MASGRRTVITVLTSCHALLSIVAALLYFFFVLPRLPELDGHVTHAFGTALRIVAGAITAAAAIPVLILWSRSRRPEYATPRLALTLRGWSWIGHLVAAVVITATAIAEIWLDLDRFGIWEFAAYGAGAAIAVLGAAAYYLAFLAELPEKPRKPRPPKSRAGASDEDSLESTAENTVDEPAVDATTEESLDAVADDETIGSPTEDTDIGGVGDEPSAAGDVAPTGQEAAPVELAPAARGLRNRRTRNRIATDADEDQSVDR